MLGMARLGKHFNTAEILNAFARGFHDEDRVRALVHFGGDCPACGEAFAGLAGREPERETPSHPREHREFVARALERQHLERQCAAETVIDMTPIHHAWLERALREPGTFCRLAIEEARLMQDRDTGYSVLHDAAEVVSDPCLRWIGEERWHDLRALIAAYGADITNVEEHLEQGSEDHETHAVAFLARSGVSVRTQDLEESFYLRLAEAHFHRFFEARTSPGHLAQLRFAQGVEQLLASRYLKARERFTDALRHLPERCARWRFLMHRRLAALSYRLDDLADLRRHHGEAERLAGLHGFAIDRAKVLELDENPEW